MGLFDTEDKIDYNWLIDNGFRFQKGHSYDDHILTKILRTRNPFAYININIITFEAVLYWWDIGINHTGYKHAFYIGAITDRIQMSAIMYKYSQENFSIN